MSEALDQKVRYITQRIDIELARFHGRGEDPEHPICEFDVIETVLFGALRKFRDEVLEEAAEVTEKHRVFAGDQYGFYACTSPDGVELSQAIRNLKRDA